MINSNRRVVLYTLVALGALGAGVWVSATRSLERSTVAVADALFALHLPDLEKKLQNLRQWRGKVLVVNFWATWCAPCRKEIPVFVEMQKRYQSKGLQFVGISIDQYDKTQEFAANFGINYPILIGNFDTIEVSRQAGNHLRALPFTVIVDRNGQIVATELGGITHTKLESLINPLL